MLKVTFHLKSACQMFQGKYVPEKKKDSETADQHERRTWQKKCHTNGDGQLFIPPFALKNGLESSAKWLKRKIPGEGKATYTKRFASGVLVSLPMNLTNGSDAPITIDDVEPLELFVPSDGVRGSGKRVPKIFPMIQQWECDGSALIYDDKISAETFRDHLTALGRFIGFGSMRVENGGISGRFEVSEFDSVEVS